MLVVKFSSTGHNDGYLDRLAESLQQLKRLKVPPDTDAQTTAIAIHE